MRIPSRNMSVAIGPSGGTAKEWKWPLYIEADIEQNAGSAPDTASVMLYNLSKDSIAYVKKRDQYLFVKAGEDYKQRLFFGQITPRQVEVQLHGSDTVVTVKAGDGRLAYRDTVVGLSYPSGIDRTTIINDIITDMGVPRGYIAALPAKTYANGYAFAGRARHALDDVLDAAATWRIANGCINIYLTGEPRPGKVVVVSSSTGMIGSPKQTDKGVDCEVIMNPALVPGAVYRIESRQVKGDYRITAVKTRLISDGSIWMQQITGVPR